MFFCVFRLENTSSLFTLYPRHQSIYRYYFCVTRRALKLKFSMYLKLQMYQIASLSKQNEVITSHRHPNKFLLKSARFYFEASLVMLPTSTDHIQCSCFPRPILFSYCVIPENIHTSPMEGIFSNASHPSGNFN